MKTQGAPKTEYTAERIKEMILSGKYLSGDKLPSENTLAVSLGVGRSSVREALRLLDASGYVKIIPNRGALAAATREEDLPSPRAWLEIHADQVADLLDVRSCIEPFAAELCARNISADGIHRLKRLLDSFESALDSHNWTLLAQYDLDFHRTILTESHNRYLVQLYQPLLEAFMQYSHRSFAATYSQSNTHHEHRAIYNAIALHAPEEAHIAMQLHITIAKRRVRCTEDSSPQGQES